ncbi:GNAT family N-acetyltransferase [Rhodohalobacter sp. 614A]|uniref:GNAT family N-acetyltransferase n=1 Tax=Rhodohalobacter sp. 614A TaxID=2908649 RepID=UPI001F395C71|nr:GNAT family N-acetyltransferase [Rhodohalobacter sp. 614A]
MIRNVKTSDAEQICAIYNNYITRTQVTFEEEPLAVGDIISRINSVTQNYPWLVYEEDETVLGYTYANQWKERSAYRNTVETGIYLDSDLLGKGIGSELKAVMIDELKARGFHSVISGIALPNPASIAMCEKFGFKKIAHFKEVGYKFGEWIDVAYWQLILDENS